MSMEEVVEDLEYVLTKLRRHEANHNTSPAFKCEVEGCRKPFQRADLLARHMERQYVD